MGFWTRVRLPSGPWKECLKSWEFSAFFFLFSDRKQMTCSIWIPYSDVAGRQGTWEERPHRIIEKGAVSYVFCKSIGWGEYRRI